MKDAAAEDAAVPKPGGDTKTTNVRDYRQETTDQEPPMEGSGGYRGITLIGPISRFLRRYSNSLRIMWNILQPSF